MAERVASWGTRSPTKGAAPSLFSPHPPSPYSSLRSWAASALSDGGIRLSVRLESPRSVRRRGSAARAGCAGYRVTCRLMFPARGRSGFADPQTPRFAEAGFLLSSRSSLLCFLLQDKTRGRPKVCPLLLFSFLPSQADHRSARDDLACTQDQ